MVRVRADWVLPVAGDPIRDGFVEFDEGRIREVGRYAGGEAVPFGRAVILPGLVNAHTHLELSFLRGRIPPAQRFVEWVRPLLAARREGPGPDDPLIVSAAESAMRQARSTGTALVGEVSNTLVTVPVLRDAGLAARVFYELIGFSGGDAGLKVADARARVDGMGEAGEDVRLSLAAHAPYSVSPALFAAIRRDLDAHPGGLSSVHLGESPEEVELLQEGTGPWRRLLEELGHWDEAWRPPRCSPVDYLDELGFLDGSVLAVHGVQFDGGNLARLRERETTIVSCPRSNRYVGVGRPPLEQFYAMNVDVAFGTDSLASVEDLNMFAELTEARRIAPAVSARRLLRSATLVGARALGFGSEFGSLEPGKRAALVAVRVPEGVTDVEEYLVSGVQPDAVTWLDEATPNLQLPESNRR